MVAATNFTYRAQQVASFTVGISFANGSLTMTTAVRRRPEGEANAEAIGFDSQTKRLYLTNVVGRLEPMAVARAIGSKTADATVPLKIYHMEEFHEQMKSDFRSDCSIYNLLHSRKCTLTQKFVNLQVAIWL